jgi:argininosuccinate lyase
MVSSPGRSGCPGRLVRLGTAVVRGLRPNVEVLRRTAGGNFTGAADLAEALSVAHGLDYRTTYRIVGRAVAAAVAAGQAGIDAEAVETAAAEEIGRPLGADPALVARCADPAALVAGRAVAGGANPVCVRRHAADVLAAAGRADEWRAARRDAVRQSRAELLDAVDQLTSTSRSG